MALTAQQIQTRIDLIQSARDTGALVVRHGDTSTQFRSLAEMDQIIASLQKQLERLRGSVKPRLRYIVQSTKGFD